MTNINTPAIIPFPAGGGLIRGDRGCSVPGGGYRFLVRWSTRVTAIGRWLCAPTASRSLFLEYRLAHAPASTYQVREHALMDVQRAIRTVRARANEWNVDPARVGVMGFSAGGEVAALAASEFDHPVKGTSDAKPTPSTAARISRPLYPGMPTPVPTPNSRTPPAFLCGAFDDGFKLTTPMARYYLALADAGVPTELHIYARGGHGFGIRDEKPAGLLLDGPFHGLAVDDRESPEAVGARSGGRPDRSRASAGNRGNYFLPAVLSLTGAALAGPPPGESKELIYVDSGGVMRWRTSKVEVAMLGANYQAYPRPPTTGRRGAGRCRPQETDR